MKTTPPSPDASETPRRPAARPTLWAASLLCALVACGPKTLTAPASGRDATAPATAPSSTTEWLDVAYTTPAGADSPWARIDLYQRPGTAPQPLVLLIHGGGWVGGDKANFADRAPHFIPWWLDRGYTVAAVTFRLASPVYEALTVSPKDQASDIAHALAWLHTHADDYNLSAQDTVLLGFSSGAHLVALLGADETYVEAAGLSEQSIAATISLDVHAYDVPYALSLMVGSDVEKNIPLITHLFGDTEAEQLSASPIAFTDTWVAPAMLVSVGSRPHQPGTHGYIVDQTAQRYAAALEAEGHTAATFHDPAKSHTSLAVGFGREGDAATQQVETFLQAR